MQRDWPDVLVLDVEMPRMDGITFLRKIMAERPTPAIICSTLTEAGAAITLAGSRSRRCVHQGQAGPSSARSSSLQRADPADRTGSPQPAARRRATETQQPVPEPSPAAG